MTASQMFLSLIPIAYLIGSIPFGFVVGKAKGVDVRAAGSGNIGATNVGRLLGRKFFFLVFSLDVLKGFLPMLAASMVLRNESRESISQVTYVQWLLVGFAAIVGHMFPVWLKFKGGKGVATGLGVLFGLWPYYTLAGVIVLAVWIVIFKLTRYVSVASMLATAAFPIVYVVIALRRQWDPFGRQLPLLLFAMLVVVLIVYKHRGNIARLRAGTENRAGAPRTNA